VTRKGKSLAVASMLLSIFVVQATWQATAQARCRDTNAAIVSELKTPAGEVLVTEQPVVGTCDGNNTYRALVKGGRNGWYPTVWIQNDNVWSRAFTGTANETYKEYSYADNNSHSLMHFCLSTDTRLGYGTWICGWGTDYARTFTHEYNGVNDGF
jgi:hypothetical protein